MGNNRCIFEYRYRDSGNFKTYGRLLLEGQDKEAEATIRGYLEWDDQFVAEQVGIPALYKEHWISVEDGPSDLDHAFHEFVCLRAPGPEEKDLPTWGTLVEMIRRMRSAAQRWDVRLSPNCDL
ncbi:MAG: hypothetical protein WDA70_10535 [Lysobacteraceae bacterium]